ncbi:hypothetical protein [Phytoactinopolyspora endophytica]|uniref:hypothetical protein n=1 Tax=Phytoactinopolyspora endophytica TaxID=1642495 RepID=UPI00101CCF59|nr:hypothetical protein [Phytoactinopolyspora endophytica]
MIGREGATDVTMLSAEGTMLLAEHACRINPMPVLDAVIEKEKELRDRCKRGRTRLGGRGSDDSVASPEWEYEWYRTYYRPVHELLRQWCGHRAITLQERLAAAEAENSRLEALVNRLIDDLADKGDLRFARTVVEELENERITPDKIGPVVERPYTHPRSQSTTSTAHAVGGSNWLLSMRPRPTPCSSSSGPTSR